MWITNSICYNEINVYLKIVDMYHTTQNRLRYLGIRILYTYSYVKMVMSYRENMTKTAKKTPITSTLGSLLAVLLTNKTLISSPSSHSPPILWSPYYHPLLLLYNQINHGIHTGRPPSRHLPTSKGNACPRSDTLCYTRLSQG